MSSPPDIDPYAVLGVSKDATITEIRAAHRKRVLKCHPDKILDESQRNVAQDEFQRVQQAYELLSDEGRRTRHDQKVKLAELKREILERRRTESYSSPRGSGASSREFRDGHIVEERVPVEVFLDEALRFTDEPRPMARKYEEFGKRPKSRPTEDKKKVRVPTSSDRAAKELRDNAKASHSERQRRRDRERQRQASEKYDRFGPYMESEDDASDSSGSDIYVRLKRPSRRARESPRPQPAETSRRRERVYEDEKYDRYGSKYDSWQTKATKAEEHIERSKYENDLRPRAPRSPQRARGYEPAEPESSASRRSGRTSRSTRNRSSSRNNSYEDLESPRGYDFKPPKMPSSSTSPGHKSSIRPSLFSTRSATATAFTRSKREPSSREEPSLSKMAHESVPPRSSKLRDRYDSGYSSPSTPEMTQGSSPKVTARYKIEPDPIIIEPSSKSKYYRSTSPDRERTSRMQPKRASTFAAYAPETSPRIEVRSVRPSRTHDNVEYTRRVPNEDIKFTREIRPSDINVAPGRSSYYYSDRHPPAGRRQSTVV
ncbi:uncharacterized protein N7459_002817 [Penicillium hispanicum]|uniref:uncharacterized protein n=1 Tax=Penicillium hispanicum TaxID=1080232 RepID=UPI002541FE46|nr:uncharacterized protein N7459_002817 [Penicillium hispanicum]KAJ5587052.1 hypothetical protein N7459_002817 [Penicillium hispanicum]